MLANELIDQLERRGLLDQEIIEALREQLDQGGARVTPEAVAKLLVDNGQLTRFQATKLIGELRSGEYADDATVAAEEVIEDLDIVDDDVVEVEAVDAMPVEVVGDGFSDFDGEAVEAIPVEAVAVEAVAIASDDMLSGAPQRDRPQARRTKPEPKENQWDSFKIYGFLGIIGFLLLSGGLLYWILSRGNADDSIQLANKLYDDQVWLEAQKRYDEFLDTFGDS
ncbi:MAG: hypothetical protein KDB00_16135, partial [Planctomycetales bacterium]|nr:hypothetical protein [Planctomycetales bacterium]